jgi:magnesium chelatase family protein
VQVATTLCRGQLGLEAPLVQVEVNLAGGLPAFSIVGLPAAAVRESKERVRAALENSGFRFPVGHITVNLAPADLPKEGGRFDLPIALGILLASGQVESADATGPGGALSGPAPGSAGDAPPGHAQPGHAPREFYGELGLSGALKPVKGVLLAAAQAARERHEILVPSLNAHEAAIVARKDSVLAAGHLLEACAYVRGERPDAQTGERPGVEANERPGASSVSSAYVPAAARPPALDLSEIRGQHHAKRALIIAAAGAHSLLFSGPPGAGKSMLAAMLPDLLPPLTRAEALQVAMIASVSASGFDPRGFGHRPFRSPHHTASASAIVGGGPHVRPGEASLAHRGVLFLDELPEFDRRVLEALREPLESGVISLSRARMQARYPAAFQLVAAMNPCPCGYLGDAVNACRCTPAQVQRYRARISGPLLDRIDLHIPVERVPAGSLLEGGSAGETTRTGVEQVTRTRARQLARAGKLNAALTAAELRGAVHIAGRAKALLETACDRLGLSARSYHRILRVALTIADLAGSDVIEPPHVAEAVQLRRNL